MIVQQDSVPFLDRRTLFVFSYIAFKNSGGNGQVQVGHTNAEPLPDEVASS